MTYLLEIKETKESKALIEHLKSLKYVTVKHIDDNEESLADEIKRSEKSKKVSWEDGIKQIDSWK